MRSTVVILVLALVGCTRSKTPAYAVGGAASAAGVILVAATAARPDCSGHLGEYAVCGIERTWTYVLGALLLTAGLSALAVGASIDVPEPGVPAHDQIGANPFVPAVEIPPPPSEDPRLRELTIQASVAASVGRCDEVAALANAVESLDRGYRIAGFVRDPKVRACLY